MVNTANGAQAKSLDTDDNSRWADKHAAVLAIELAAIARRRAGSGVETPPPIGHPGPGQTLDVTGLALSGGGVRSAAIGLGVLQALNDGDLLKRIDYLSTVSGGGYIGCSLTAAMAGSGVFPFGNAAATPHAGVGAVAPQANDISDTPAVGHIRNYSNYLIPNGFRDGLSAAAIIVRGLVANFALVLPVLLVLASFTIFCNPFRSRLAAADLVGLDLSSHLKSNFGMTLVAAALLLLLYYFWGTGRYLEKIRRLRILDAIGSFLIVGFVAIAFAEFQPFVIEGMFQIANSDAGDSQGLILGLFTSWVKTLAAVAAPVAAVVTFFQRQLGGLLKSVTAGSSATTMAAAYLTRAAVWVGGLALPLLLWIAYLYLCFWGIANDCFYPPKVDRIAPPAAVAANVTVTAPGLAYSGALKDTAKAARAAVLQPVCDQQQKIPEGWTQRKTYDHVPNWLMQSPPDAAKATPGSPRDLQLLYWAIVIALALGSQFLLPNSNSLHQLYRDRLGKAFLFDPDPKKRMGVKPAFNEASRDQGRDFAELDMMKLSKLSDVHAPYHLINAALNIQGSDYANRRGRNADFFSFSRDWIGSEATGYAPTAAMEHKAPELDLATAMAISGAAASSNMGANTIRPLTPTLALLNIRLGYWLTNPKPLAERLAAPRRRRFVLRNSSLYLWQELSGRLYENSDAVYLTDGGHIENLGIYELLRRRCRLIIAVDAEADSAMHFPSLVTLQRYARIDLGVRLNLPWEPIQAQTQAWMKSNEGKPPTPAPVGSGGPHVAIGIIDYGGGQTGYLVYIKSSLTGDENDYVRDYARRYASFPHETTGDQFFSEEQFEVYRALGFHMTHGFLSGNDDVVVAVSGRKHVSVKFADDSVATVRAVREILGLPVKPLAPVPGTGV
ncbi:patatin-like phospholipase family protein [Tardiphaga sp.]|uniref:patatin-like phospholipase family protein n=1 Tax=Tardiphaga sp. TaxID=1926292 RepID=UPI00261D88BA|nr:patatin-like phospholipase family protein [Tardiphaga sp.]MDB5616324.1 hypothetical protein [Tardiphaga sp.]